MLAEGGAHKGGLRQGSAHAAGDTDPDGNDAGRAGSFPMKALEQRSRAPR